MSANGWLAIFFGVLTAVAVIWSDPLAAWPPAFAAGFNAALAFVVRDSRFRSLRGEENRDG